jgi:hypothetical protein
VNLGEKHLFVIFYAHQSNLRDIMLFCKEKVSFGHPEKGHGIVVSYVVAVMPEHAKHLADRSIVETREIIHRIESAHYFSCQSHPEGMY